MDPAHQVFKEGVTSTRIVTLLHTQGNFAITSLCPGLGGNREDETGSSLIERSDQLPI